MHPNRRKTLAYTAAYTLLYCFIFYVSVLSAINGFSKNQAYDSSDMYLLLGIIWLIGFPFIQRSLSKKLRKLGKIEHAEGLSKSIIIELILVVAMLFFISQLGR